jgi:hypothetical protein
LEEADKKGSGFRVWAFSEDLEEADKKGLGLRGLVRIWKGPTKRV